MASSEQPVAAGLPWHPALAFAVTGVRMDDLGQQPRPDLAALAQVIIERSPDGLAGLAARVAERRRAGEVWPYPIPDDLAAGLGAAQRHAALGDLIDRLQLDLPPSTRILVDRPPDADDRRLLTEVPPHHGH